MERGRGRGREGERERGGEGEREGKRRERIKNICTLVNFYKLISVYRVHTCKMSHNTTFFLLSTVSTCLLLLSILQSTIVGSPGREGRGEGERGKRGKRGRREGREGRGGRKKGRERDYTLFSKVPAPYLV